MSDYLSDLKFGRIDDYDDGLVRLGMNGQMAIRVGYNGEYKYYDAKKKRLVNCNNFTFNFGSEFFFVVPTNNVKTGDIILINGEPAYVLEPETNGEIKILYFEDSSIKHILPERYLFLGDTYMYSKIISLLGNKRFDKNTMMKFMMMKSLFGRGDDGENSMFGGGMNPMMLMMMTEESNPLANMFENMFDFSDMTNGLFGKVLDNTAEDQTEEVEDKATRK